MQNEERINGLETQVRTLKRIVYGFGCLLVAGVVEQMMQIEMSAVRNIDTPILIQSSENSKQNR